MIVAGAAGAGWAIGAGALPTTCVGMIAVVILALSFSSFTSLDNSARRALVAKDVVADILSHFREKLGVELRLFDGGSKRTNLDFVVVETSVAQKFADIHQTLLADLPPDAPGGAIVYCASRKQTEEVAAFLREKELAADYFHAGLQPETKKSVQQRFIRGDLRVIAATARRVALGSTG